MNNFEVKITTDANEIREAQRLRFQVFNLEMKRGLQASYARGLDCDDFDAICDHLIVGDFMAGELVVRYGVFPWWRADRIAVFFSNVYVTLDIVEQSKG